jgi:hypothetical protein
MKCNVGGADRTFRFVLGAALVGIGTFVDMSNSLRIAAFTVAAIAIGTAAIRYCPANSVFGIDTCRKTT